MSKKNNTNKKISKKLVALVALLLAGAAALSASIANLFKKSKQNEGIKSKDSVTTTIDDKELKSIKGNIDDLGIDLDIKKEKKAQYGAVETYVQGVDIKPEDVVEVVDPKTGETVTYVNKEAASKSDKVGTVTYDTTATQTVLEDGTVIENGTGYEIVDSKTGETISGNSAIPEGYVEISPGTYAPQDKADTYFIAQVDYWTFDINGNAYIIINKGERVNKADFEAVKGSLYDHKPDASEYKVDKTVTVVEGEPEIVTTPETASVQTSSTPQATNTPDEFGGVINPNGTYTIYGNTYINEETYKRIYKGEDDIYMDDDGVIWIKSDYEKYIGISSSQRVPQKVLTIGQRKIIR